VTVEIPPAVPREPHPFVASGAHKLAAQVARRIEADILASGWQVGSVFGSEGELRERYGISRAVLREAIRLVEHREVAVMRRGPSGGLVVRAPDSGPLTAAMVIYLEHVGTSVEDLLAVRMLLEPLAARLAAKSMDEAGIQTMRETLEQEQSLPLEVSGRDLMHSAVGRLSGNPALRLFIDVLVDLTLQYAVTPQRTTAGEVAEANQASLDAHAAIVDAIVSGETGLAEQRAIRHLEAMREWLQLSRQRPIVSNTGAATRRLGETAPEANGTGKLAETVARRMMDEIAASGARVGEVIGSESDLLDRFGVSRAVFREAVRLLEYHSVARMRRGPGGGLVVAEPDATASVEAMAIYLDYEKISIDDLRAVRDVLEMGCLERVVARSDEAAVAERLRNAVHSDGASGAHGWDDVHTEIAELTGNPVMALLMRIITMVWARHSGELDENSVDDPATVELVTHVHERIVDAVLAGDLPLARHRMRRHLEALDAWWQ
jgi:DNA-binding FadR family transcriptional regulator